VGEEVEPTAVVTEIVVHNAPVRIHSRPSPSLAAVDLALGLTVRAARTGTAAARVALAPARRATGLPLVSVLGRRATRGLIAEGRAARRQARAVLMAALDGPLPEAVGRSLAEHRVPQRMAAPIIASVDVEEVVAATLEREDVRLAVSRALASPQLGQIVGEAAESPLLDDIVGHVAASPQLREAIASQSSGLAEDVVSGLRGQARRLDDRAEHRIRRLLLRPPRVPDR
jgi:hypothetical protein